MSVDSEKSTQTVLLKTKEASDNLSKENWYNLFTEIIYKNSLDNNLSQSNVEENKGQTTFVTEVNRDVKEVVQQATLTIWTLTKHLPWWRHLEDVFKTSFVFVFRRRLKDVLIKTNISTWVKRLQKTSSRRLQDVLVKTNIFVLAIPLQDVFKTFSRSFQDFFKTSCYDVLRRVAKTSSRQIQNVFKTFWRRLQDIFKTSWKRLQDIFKMSSRRFEDTLQRYFQDFFKMYHQVKLFLLTRFQDVFGRY